MLLFVFNFLIFCEVNSYHIYARKLMIVLFSVIDILVALRYLLHDSWQLVQRDLGPWRLLLDRRLVPGGDPRFDGLARLHQAPDVPDRLGVLAALVRRPVPAVERHRRLPDPDGRLEPVHCQRLPARGHQGGREAGVRWRSIAAAAAATTAAGRPANVHRTRPNARRVRVTVDAAVDRPRPRRSYRRLRGPGASSSVRRNTPSLSPPPMSSLPLSPPSCPGNR